MNKFVERYKEQVEDFSLEYSLPKTIRVKNKDELDTKIKLIHIEDDIYSYESKINISSTLSYLKGDVFVQALPSYHSIKILDPKEDELILDMAAAPGSKTVLISEFMKNKGNIIAIEPNSKRAEKLKFNLEKSGCKNVIIIQKDARFFESEEKFDKILLDAPCSGNFSVEQNWFEKRTMADIKEKARLQKELIKQANKLLKKGGILVYSTCRLEIEEDEQNKEYMEKLGYSVEYEKKYWPHIENTIGFYIVKAKKTL